MLIFRILFDMENNFWLNNLWEAFNFKLIDTA